MSPKPSSRSASRLRSRGAELVGGRLAHGREAPVVDQLIAAEDAEVGLGVADVDDEEHGAGLCSARDDRRALRHSRLASVRGRREGAAAQGHPVPARRADPGRCTGCRSGCASARGSVPGADVRRRHARERLARDPARARGARRAAPAAAGRRRAPRARRARRGVGRPGAAAARAARRSGRRCARAPEAIAELHRGGEAAAAAPGRRARAGRSWRGWRSGSSAPATRPCART